MLWTDKIGTKEITDAELLLCEQSRQSGIQCGAHAIPAISHLHLSLLSAVLPAFLPCTQRRRQGCFVYSDSRCFCPGCMHGTKCKRSRAVQRRAGWWNHLGGAAGWLPGTAPWVAVVPRPALEPSSTQSDGPVQTPAHTCGGKAEELVGHPV
jgi:hypothetical protein